MARERAAHVASLREALTWSCAHLNIDVRRWVLPLSGGRDSRALLAFMARGGLRPRCVTWTTHSSARQPLSDAFIARLVARRFGVEHELVWLDGHDDEPAAALDRFVAVAEGRSDEYSGYTDGCRIWRDLFADGASGVIRGDESAGIRRRAASPQAARATSAGAMVSDFPSTHLIHRLGLAEQVWPERLREQPGESLDAYRDRMYEQSRLPGALAPFNDVKGRYVEVVNPLLSKRLIGAVHELPDELRAFGRVYNEVVDGESRPIPYARFNSTPAVSDCLEDPGLIEAIVRELSSARAERVFDREEAVLSLLAPWPHRNGAAGHCATRRSGLSSWRGRPCPRESRGVSRRATAVPTPSLPPASPSGRRSPARRSPFSKTMRHRCAARRAKDCRESGRASVKASRRRRRLSPRRRPRLSTLRACRARPGGSRAAA